MPKSSAPSFLRPVRVSCWVVVLMVFLALALLAPRLDAQTAPEPGGGDRRPGHDQRSGSHPAPSFALPVQPPSSSSTPRFTPQVVGTTILAGSIEPGPSDPDGSGTAAIRIDIGGQQVCVTINVSNVSTANAAHIHRGAAGVAGPIVVNLPVPVNGSVTGCTPVNQLLATEIVTNPAAFYINVHTTEFPAGAVRGQVVLAQPTNLQAILTGAAQVPPADPDGAGVAALAVDQDTNQVCVLIDVANIGPATLSHIHQGAAGVNGPIVVDLPIPSAGSATGCATNLSAALLQNIVANPAGFYVNIHNTEFPNGAVRGQLQIGAPITHIASMTGAAEVPGPGDPDGAGLSTLVVDPANQRICIGTVVQGIATASAAHIHTGTAGVAGGILVHLPVPDAGGAAFGCVEGINGALVTDIFTNPNTYYVNVHNGDFPSGAIRGQIARITVPPCGPRQPVRVQAQVVTEGGVTRLRATVAAQTSQVNPINALTSVQFTVLSGARVSILPNGPANQTAPFLLTIATSTNQVQFDVFRVTPGQAATVRLIATDACGAWPTFVGAGPGVGI